jgi:hypothetical protein
VARLDLPMDKTKLVYGFNGQNTLSHVELCDVLGERVIFDQPDIHHLSADVK